MSEAIEVSAEVIEPEGALEVRYTPAVLSDNLDALDGYVDGIVESYRGFQIDPDDYSQVKSARAYMAHLNKVKGPIEDERKRIRREYEAPLRAFEERVKQITSKIDGARDLIKEQVDEADRRFRESRREMLREEYEGCAGELADVIAFDAVLDKRWLNRSTNEVKAVNELYERMQVALSGYRTLMARELFHKDEVVKRFAETLDAVSALQLEDELNERDREVAEFRARREAAEATVAERAAARIEEHDPGARAVAAGGTVLVADRREPGQPAGILRYSLSLEFEGTREYAMEVADALRALGITGATIKCIGVIQDDE